MCLLLVLGLVSACQSDFLAVDQPVRGDGPSFSKAHGLIEAPFQLTITPKSEGSTVFYTLDGSEPTSKSAKYTGPLSVSHTTIIRAAEKGRDGRWSRTSTASYLFPDDILDFTKAPEGYPAEWGPYNEIDGRAKADYVMDPVMTGNPELRAKMKEGLSQIPIVSIVTDKDNFFKDSKDPDYGGIYIYTGAPVGDMTGRGWERPVSCEIFDGGSLDVTIDCGIKIHGGHSRLAEKNPKHAFRLKFKDEYGPKKLHASVFGSAGPDEFNTLTLRTFFGNSWQHWSGDNRARAQYVRDMWARTASARLGMPHSAGRHVHVFLNGMYWGIYCLSERIDESYCQTHFGGHKEDYEVLKVDEAQSNAVVADWGGYSKYAELTALKGDDFSEIERLLDVDEFIDYMILNQYDGNTDWDYHNWFAIRNAAANGGFRFLVWDSEGILVDANTNVLNLNTKGKPTGLFQTFMKNPEFKARFEARVRELTSPGGLLTPGKSVEIWDSLYHSIDKALYLEAARWGDYRYEVHPYSSKGKRYDVENTYMTERKKMIDDIFPYRTRNYLDQLRAKGWYNEE